MAATTPVLIPLEEYLRTVYRPDCDYIDGEVLERNMGEIPHGCLQSFFAFYFRLHRDDWQIEVFTETRLQVSKSRFRVPDVMLVSPNFTEERVVETPAMLCVEILSSEDRMRKVQERIDDYARMGVLSTWAIDPWRELAYAAGRDGILRPAEDHLSVEGTPIQISAAEVWAELARLEKRRK